MSIADDENTLDAHDLEGALEKLICSLVRGNEEAVKSLIRLLFLIDRMDDDDKPLVIWMAIEYAFNTTHAHDDSLSAYLREIANDESASFFARFFDALTKPSVHDATAHDESDEKKPPQADTERTLIDYRITPRFNETLRDLVSWLVQDSDEGAMRLVKVMLMIQGQVDADSMGFVASLASEHAYLSSNRCAARERDFVNEMRAELLAEFEAGKGGSDERK